MQVILLTEQTFIVNRRKSMFSATTKGFHFTKARLTSLGIFNKTRISSQTIIAEASVTVENDAKFIKSYFEKRPFETVLLDHMAGFEEKVIPMDQHIPNKETITAP